MSTSRSAQFQTETPFLPQPIAGDVLDAVTRPFETIGEGDTQYARLTTLRTQLMAAIDTIELAISSNHADYLGGRRCWSYETRIEVDTRLRILKRQLQHLAEACGRCNRRLKRLQHEADEVAYHAQTAPDHARSLAFVQVAQQFLDPATLVMLWEIVDTQSGTRMED